MALPRVPSAGPVGSCDSAETRFACVLNLQLTVWKWCSCGSVAPGASDLPIDIFSYIRAETCTFLACVI